MAECFNSPDSSNDTVQQRLDQYLLDYKLTLPSAALPKGAYQTVVVSGDWAYVAGHLPIQADGNLITGRLGLPGTDQNSEVEKGYRACQWAGLNILATLKANLGSLDRVKQVVKIVGFVQCADDFHAQAAVLNGASELMRAVFGPGAGQAARSALGANSLPLDSMVEVEAVVRIG